MVAIERNARVAARYDELMREGKHGHYETLFRVVREEVERRPVVKALLDSNRHLRQRNARLSAILREWLERNEEMADYARELLASGIAARSAETSEATARPEGQEPARTPESPPSPPNETTNDR